MGRNISSLSKIGKKNKTLFQTTKYIDIPLSFDDVYLFVTIGDRYDTLASKYYQDSSMWWIIALANPTQSLDSIIPTPGSQIRIPNIQTATQINNLYN